MKKLIVFIFLIPFLGLAQLSEKEKVTIDSLKTVVENAMHDSTKADAWMIWSGIIYQSNPELDLLLNQKIDSLCSTNLSKDLSKKEVDFFTEFREIALQNIGNVYISYGDFQKALSADSIALVSAKKSGNKGNIVIALQNMSYVHTVQGNNARATELLSKALKIAEEIGDTIGIAGALNSLGMQYSNQKDNTTALMYFKKSLRLGEETENSANIISALVNIAGCYRAEGKSDEALKTLFKSLKIVETTGDKTFESYINSDIGEVYREEKQYKKALKFSSKALEIGKETDNIDGIVSSYLNMGIVYQEQGLYKKSLKYGKRGLKIAQEAGFKNLVESASELLYEVYKKTGQSSNALKMYELFVETRDSLNSEESQKAIIRQEYKYEYEKQAEADSVKAAEATKIKNAELALEHAENEQYKLQAKQQKQQQYFLFGGLALAILFGGFIFNRFRVTNKQKGIIEGQKKQVDEAFDELEIKNTEILDSINYAKGIQSAILPPLKLVKEYLIDSFILYKPKDIIAGDFYWLEHVNDKVLFAAADCTGHGVPGAMISVVCNNALNRSVREYGLTDPGQILDKTRDIVSEEFQKSEHEVKDGMDIALCSLEGNTLKYAGANNPLWIIRNAEIIETKADKQPIGKFDKQSSYTTHEFILEKGDAIYVFSDGFVDQFGGEKGKKFKPTALRKLLLSMQDKNMEEQCVLLDSAFENWKGDIEQVDDVCVIGLRYNK